MPGHFLEIPVFLGDYFFMPHPVYVGKMLLYQYAAYYVYLKKILVLPFIW